MNWLTRFQTKASTPRKQSQEQIATKFKNWDVEWVRRSRAKGISLQVRPLQPLRVVSPKGASWILIEQFLHKKESWIQKHLDQFQEMEKKHPPKKLLSDESYLFLGTELRLRYLPTPLKAVFFSRTEAELRLHLPENLYAGIADQELTSYLPLLKKFYRREAEKFLKERIEIWSFEMGLPFQKLSFRNQKTRWGSCTSNGHISLNWKLIATPLFVLDSVLIHELAHLRHMNHSRLFWNLVEQFCPEYSLADKWLKENHRALNFLSSHPRQ
jgi:predicted metal-dependent hydrolase